jgi:hypothetical protein
LRSAESVLNESDPGFPAVEALYRSCKGSVSYEAKTTRKEQIGCLQPRFHLSFKVCVHACHQKL